MSKRKGADAANGKAPGKKTKSKAEACDAGRVRFDSPGKGARAAEPMPNFVMLKEKYLLTNAYMNMVENAVAITAPVSPSKKPKKNTFATVSKPSSSSSDPSTSPRDKSAVVDKDPNMLYSAWIDTNRVHLPRSHHFNFGTDESKDHLDLGGLIRPVKVKHAEGLKRSFEEMGLKYDPAKPVGTGGDDNVDDDDDDKVEDDDDDVDDDDDDDDDDEVEDDVR